MFWTLVAVVVVGLILSRVDRLLHPDDRQDRDLDW